MNRFRTIFVFPLIALILLIVALSSQMFKVSPIGKLLDPFVGAVQNGGDLNLTSSQLKFDKMRLSDSVSVYFDERKVPHIYAKTSGDLYFTQGYVTASLRLWQMDFLTYVSAGRLAELFDEESMVSYDRTQRRLGVLESAKTTLKFIEQDPETDKVLTAYTNGVNSYISQLTYKQFPFEYKLLNYEPEPWSKLKTVLILKTLGNTLAGYDDDLLMSKIILALGEEKFNKLFPDFDTHTTPVMDIAKPKTENFKLAKPEFLNYLFMNPNQVVPKSAYNPKLGSNSWAVSGKKTKSGFPILASDPHLNLSFPCFWLEMQLTSPDINVYGVTIPGAPSIIIGFNENIAWGITNGADDVKDWYKLKITEDFKKYEMDGKWLDLKYRIEEIKRIGHKTLNDTIYSTIHGPLVYTKSFNGKQPDLINFALKWALHDPSNEFKTFIKLNSAKDYKGYKDAVQYFSCPILNFTFAGKDNTIAMNHQGSMAIKQKGQGRFLMDGTKKSEIPTRTVPSDSLPQLLNPVTNYVLSANQHPTYSNYKYYYNGYYSETRANQIKRMLDKENAFDIKKMEAVQLDNTNSFAVDVLPVLMRTIDSSRLSSSQKELLKRMSTWQGKYDFDDENARLFEFWWKNVKEYTWDEFKGAPFFSKTPADYTLLDLIRNNVNDEYFDVIGTAKKENASDVITEAFVTAAADYDKLSKEGSLKWGDFNKVSIMHMTNMPAFSKRDISVAGYPEAINAMAGTWGPSWRMIVELGDTPKAYGIYPGGQSGNVGSKYYDNFVTDWSKGKYYSLHLFMSESAAKKEATTTWVLR